MLSSTSPRFKIKSSITIHHHHHTNNDNNILHIDVVINLHYKSSYYAGNTIIVELEQHHKSKSFSFSLSLLLDEEDEDEDEDEHRVVIDSDNVFEHLWDPAMEELDNLGVDRCLRPRIVDEIASAYLRCGEGIPSPLIVLDVEVAEEDSSPDKEVIKGLLIDRGIITLDQECGARGTRCAICLEEEEEEEEEELLVVGRLRCNHVYHVECLVKWVLNCGTNSKTSPPSCPLCRFPLFAAH